MSSPASGAMLSPDESRDLAMAEPSNIIMTEEPTPVAPVRSCGSCSLCCKLLVIDELDKPPDTWCPHCKPGRGGCSIYADRPPSCRLFRCGWLDSKGSVGDEWIPRAAKWSSSICLALGSRSSLIPPSRSPGEASHITRSFGRRRGGPRSRFEEASGASSSTRTGQSARGSYGPRLGQGLSQTPRLSGLQRPTAARARCGSPPRARPGDPNARRRRRSRAARPSRGR